MFSKPANPTKTTTSRIKKINDLVEDVNIIYDNCEDQKEKLIRKKDLDEFQSSKLDLVETIKSIKFNIKAYIKIKEQSGNNADVIKLKQLINKKIEIAKQQQTTLEQVYKQDKQQFDSQPVMLLIDPLECACVYMRTHLSIKALATSALVIITYLTHST